MIGTFLVSSVFIIVRGTVIRIFTVDPVEIVTQLAFYCGWPKAWSTFPLIQEVYEEESK